MIWHHRLVKSRAIRPLKPGVWPAYSPDLSLIENLMAHVKNNVEVRFVDEKILDPSEAQWREYLEKEWNSVPVEMIHHYYDAMPKRCADCIARKGRPLKN